MCAHLDAQTSTSTTSTKEECIQLAEERDYIRKQLNFNSTPYWNERFKKTFEQYSRLCKGVEHSMYTVVKAKKKAFYNPFSDVKVDDMSSFAAMYSGEKLQAWQAYYQLPAQCRSKKPSQADFIFCAEDKTAQKAAFEKVWQQKLANHNPKLSYSINTKSNNIKSNVINTPAQNNNSNINKPDTVNFSQSKPNITTLINHYWPLVLIVTVGLVALVAILKIVKNRNRQVLSIRVPVEPQLSETVKNCPYCLSPLLRNETTDEYSCSDSPKCTFRSH